MRKPDLSAECFTGEHAACRTRRCRCPCHRPAGPYPAVPAFATEEHVMPGESLAIFSVAADETDDEIRQYIPAMKLARERGASVVCLLDGFNGDRRQISDIPQARALCRRLCDLGFISYLDVSTVLPPGGHPAPQALGAFEVWATGQGKYRRGGHLDMGLATFDALMEEFKAALSIANQEADRAAACE
jgi:hypothetical protein